MTGGRKCTRSAENLIHWHEVNALVRLGSLRHGDEVKHRQLNEQLLGVRLVEHMRVIVPLASFQVHAVGVASPVRLLFDVFRLLVIVELEAEGDLIDSDGVSSGVVLQVAREEGLREEETGHPVDNWRAARDPLVKEIDSLVAVFDPGG